MKNAKNFEGQQKTLKWDKITIAEGKFNNKRNSRALKGSKIAKKKC